MNGRPTLALDVDGVLLDSERGGHGHWSNELERRYGITQPQLRDAFFAPYWDDVVNGRRAIEPALEHALRTIGCEVAVDDVLECWFEADFVPIDRSIALARAAAAADISVALVTNQDRRRAHYL